MVDVLHDRLEAKDTRHTRYLCSTVGTNSDYLQQHLERGGKNMLAMWFDYEYTAWCTVVEPNPEEAQHAFAIVLQHGRRSMEGCPRIPFTENAEAQLSKPVPKSSLPFLEKNWAIINHTRLESMNVSLRVQNA